MANYNSWHTGVEIDTAIDKMSQIGMVDSGGDFGKKEYIDNTNIFVAEMNRLSQSIGCNNTSWRTVNGYPQQYPNTGAVAKLNSRTTAQDLLKCLILAKHTPLAFSAMSQKQYTYSLSGVQNVQSHLILNSNAWVSWATNHNYNIIAAKGGSLLGNFGTLGANGAYTMAVVINDGESDYAVAIVGMNNYPVGTPERTREQALMKTVIHGLICEIKGVPISEQTEAEDYSAVKARVPAVGMVICKLTQNGSLEDDLNTMQGDTYLSYNANEIRAAASVTKIVTACVAAKFFVSNYTLTISDTDLVGGSGISIVANDTISAIDALYLMLMASDNQLAIALTRSIGSRLNNGARFLYAESEIQNGEDLNDYTTIGTYSVPSNAVAESLLNCPSTVAGILIVEKLGTIFSDFWRQTYIPATQGQAFYTRYKTGAWHRFAPTE